MPVLAQSPSIGQNARSSGINQSQVYQPIRSNALQNNRLSAAAFALPEELGIVEEFYQGKNKQTVLFIQDAHAQLDAQMSLQDILNFASQQYGFNLLFLEGGLQGRVSTDLLRFYQNDAVNEDIAEILLKDSRITGPGLFLLKHAGKMRVYGVESEKKYFENIQSFREVYSSQERADLFLKQIKQRLTTAASNTFNPDLLDFSKQWLFYQDSHQDLLIHLAVLKRAAEEHLKLSFDDGRRQLEYPHLLRVFKLQSLEKEIRLSSFSNQTQEEKDKLIEWVQSVLFRQSLADFLKLVALADKGAAGRDLPKNARRVLESFYEEARGLGFKWEQYPHLNLLFSQIVLSQEINSVKVFEEIDQVTNRILDQLTIDAREKNVLRLYRRYHALVKLYRLELIRDEFLALKSGGARVRPGKLISALSSLVRMPFDSGTGLDEMEKLYDEAMRFYEIAASREAGIMETLKNVMSELGEDQAVVIAGGFHAEGIHRMLRQEEMSFVSVQPHISALNSSENYVDHMMLRGAKNDPRFSGVVQIAIDRIPMVSMPLADGQYMARAVRRAMKKVTTGLGGIPLGPALPAHQMELIGGNLNRAEVRSSPRERGLMNKGLDLGKLQKFISKQVKEKNQGGAGADYGGLTPEILAVIPKGERMDSLAFRASEEQALHNLVKNSLDWNLSRDGSPVPPKNQSRLHGEGGLGFLAELQGREPYAVLESKTLGGRGFRVTLWNMGSTNAASYRIYFEYADDLSFDHGTRVTVYKVLEKPVERLRDIRERISANTAAPIFVNKEQANHPENFLTLDPQHGQVDPGMNPVAVSVGTNGYRVDDRGQGMSPEDFFEKFLMAGISIEENEILQQERQRLPEDTRLYASPKISTKTKVEGWVNGHRISPFAHSGPERLNLVERLIVDFPPGTLHPNDANVIKLDDRAIEGIKYVIDRLTDANAAVPNRFAQINSLAFYLRQKQPLHERTHLGEADLIKYLARRIQGPQGLAAKLKEKGELKNKILVPNSYAVNNTPHGWQAFAHPRFIPLDEELFEFSFNHLTPVLDGLTPAERKILIGQDDVLNTVPIYVTGWSFKDKLRGMPVTWILDEKGKPAILIDGDVLRTQKQSLTMIANLLQVLSPQLRAVLDKKGIKIKPVPEVKNGNAHSGILGALYKARGWIVGLVAVGLFLILPLIKIAREMRSESKAGKDESNRAVATAKADPEKEKPRIVLPLSERIPERPPRIRELPREEIKPSVPRPEQQEEEQKQKRPARPPIKIPASWTPKAENQPQSVKTERKSDGLIVPATTGTPRLDIVLSPNPANAGNVRRIENNHVSPFNYREKDRIRVRSGPIPTMRPSTPRPGEVAPATSPAGGAQQNQQAEQQDPRYGYVINPVLKDGENETLTIEIFPGMDESGLWMLQPEVQKRVREGAIPVDLPPISIRLWGDVIPGAFPLYNYHTGVIKNVRVRLVDRKTKEVDENATKAWQNQWERKGDRLIFKEGNPAQYLVVVVYDVDYYNESDISYNLEERRLSAVEREDFKKYFGKFFEGMEGKSDTEKLQAVMNFLNRVAVYDKYATPEQGAVTILGHRSWSEALFKSLTRGVDPAKDPHEAVLEGLAKGNKGRVICNNGCAVVAPPLDFLGFFVAYVSATFPQPDLTVETITHGKVLVESKDNRGVWFELDPTKFLNYEESEASESEPGAGEAGGLVQSRVDAVQKQNDAFRNVIDRLEALEKSGALPVKGQALVLDVLNLIWSGGSVSDDQGKKFFEELNRLKNHPDHGKEISKLLNELSRNSYSYSTLTSNWQQKDDEARYAERERLSEEANKNLMTLLSEASVNGDLDQNTLENVLRTLQKIKEYKKPTVFELFQLVEVMQKLENNPNYGERAAQVIIKLRFHNWSIDSAFKRQYLGELIGLFETLSKKGVLSPEEYKNLEAWIIAIWEQRSLTSEDYFHLSEWLDFLSFDKEHGSAVRERVERLAEEHYQLKSAQKNKNYWRMLTTLQEIKQNENIEDEELDRLLEMMRGKAPYFYLTPLEDDEFYKLLRSLQNKFPDHEKDFYFIMEIFNSGEWDYWARNLQLQDGEYLADRLAGILEGVVPADEVYDYADRLLKLEGYEKEGLQQLLKIMEEYKKAEDPQTLKENFKSKMEKLEKDESRIKERNRQAAADAWWNKWGVFVFAGTISFIIMIVTAVMQWFAVREILQEERNARRSKNPFPGHKSAFRNPEAAKFMPKPRTASDKLAKNVLYARLRESYDRYSRRNYEKRFPVLGTYGRLDENGYWRQGTKLTKVTKKGAQKQRGATQSSGFMRGRVQARQRVPLITFPSGVIGKVSIVRINEDGNRSSQPPPKAKREGDSVVFEEPGIVEIRYNIDYYSPSDLYFLYPHETLPDNEKSDIQKYFGSGKKGLDPWLNSHPNVRLSAVNQFMEDHVIFDLAATDGPLAFKREPHHTSWAHALHEHIAQNKSVRVNSSTAVLIKGLIASYLGFPVARLSRMDIASSEIPADWEIGTEADERDGLLIGFPIETYKKQPGLNPDRAADRLIEEFDYRGDRNLIPVAQGRQNSESAIEWVWVLNDWSQNLKPDLPPNSEVAWALIKRRLIPLLTMAVDLFIKIIWGIIWPIPWIKEGFKRGREVMRERAYYRKAQREMNRIWKEFNIPAASPVRKILKRIPRTVYRHNRWAALLGRPNRARFLYLDGVLKFPDQALLKALHAYHRSQGADSELEFFAGLFRLGDPVLKSSMHYKAGWRAVDPSNHRSLNKYPSPENNDSDTRALAKHFGLIDGRAELKLSKPLIMDDDSQHFSPAYLYLEGSIHLPPEALNHAEKLLALADTNQKLEELVRVFQLAGSILQRSPDYPREIKIDSDQPEVPAIKETEAIVTRLFRRALNELERHQNLNTTHEIADFLTQRGPFGSPRLHELWRLQDEAQPEVDRIFPYPQREVIDYLIGKEGLTIEPDEHVETELGEGTGLLDHPGLKERFKNENPSLSWLVDAASLIEEKEALLKKNKQPVPGLDFNALQEAVDEAAAAREEPDNKANMLDAVHRQSQPGMVMIREILQNARDVTRDVPEDQAAEEFKRFGGKREVRVRSHLNQEHPDGQMRRILSVEDPVGILLDVLIKVYFPRWATTKSPNAVVTRILDQAGTIDEKIDLIFKKLVRENEQSNPQLRSIIRIVLEDPAAHENAVDEILLTLENFIDDDKKSAGLFGIGNYTIYDDADEVVIRTGYAGKVYRIRLKVIREKINGQDVITDIQIQDFDLFEDPQGLYKGTLVQHIKIVQDQNRSEIDLEDRYIKYLFAKYVGSVSDVNIVSMKQTDPTLPPVPSEASFRDDRAPLLQHQSVKTLRSRLGISRVTVDELYIQELGDPVLFRYVPDWALSWFKQKGINFEFKKGTAVTEARSAIRYADKSNRDVGAVSIKTLAGAYRKGLVVIGGLPAYTEFLQKPQYFFAYPVRDQAILEDAQKINSGLNISDERWRYYFTDDDPAAGRESHTAAQKYLALLLLMDVPLEGQGNQSLMKEKENLFFGNVPAWIQSQYFSNADFQNLLAQEGVLGLPEIFSPGYSQAAALHLFKLTVRLYAENKLKFTDVNIAGFPGMPYSFADYLKPSVTEIGPSATVNADLNKVLVGQFAEINFAAIKEDDARLASFLLELPIKHGKSVNKIRDDLLKQKKDPNSVDARLTASQLTDTYSVAGDDSELIAAFDDFLTQIKNVVYKKLEESGRNEFDFHTRVALTGRDNDFKILEDFEGFLYGKSEQIFHRILGYLAPENTLSTAGLFFSALLSSDFDTDALRRHLLAAHDLNGARNQLTEFVEQKRRQGLDVEFIHVRSEVRNSSPPRVTNTTERADRNLDISLVTQFDVAKAAAQSMIGFDVRSEVREILLDKLLPAVQPAVSLGQSAESLRTVIYESQERIAVISVVPGNFNRSEMERYVEGVLAGLAQKELTHEVIILIQGDADDFRGEFERVFGQRARALNFQNLAALNRMVHLVSTNKFEFIAPVLLSGMDKVVFAGPSDFDIDLTPYGTNTSRVFTDKLASGKLLSFVEDPKFRLMSGAFVSASFEAALLSGQPIDENQRILIQTGPGKWYVSSEDALDTFSQSLTEMVRRSMAIARAA